MYEKILGAIYGAYSIIMAQEGRLLRGTERLKTTITCNNVFTMNMLAPLFRVRRVQG